MEVFPAWGKRRSWKSSMSIVQKAFNSSTKCSANAGTYSFKNLREEFAFWDKNPNRSIQPDTLNKLLIALEGIPISSTEPEHVFSQGQLQL